MAEDLGSWFAGRLPNTWFVGPPEVTADGDEVLVFGTLPDVELAKGTTGDGRSAARSARIDRFREETREERVKIAREAERHFKRKVAWGVRCGDETKIFTTLSVPVMTRLRMSERSILDTLVAGGVARSRSDALAWCVRLVGMHQADWIKGAGPAGLTAAYELMKHEIPITVVEKDPGYVGGLARTVEHKGYRFDIGGHRFFSKNQEVEDLWTGILGDEMITRGRLSRIYYRGRFFAYPIKAVNALWNLGPLEAVRCVASYARARLQPVKNPKSLEDWVRNQFGWRLFSIFFKTYTEKVWGISTKELSADWAAQRIKGLDLWLVLRSALIPRRAARNRGEIVTTLIDKFRYPRFGPGQMWERVADISSEKGSPVLFGQSIESIKHEGGLVRSIVTRTEGGTLAEHSGTAFVSSIPIRELIGRLDPPAPEPVRRAADHLSYRDFISVALMIDKADVFPDNWIYVHDPSVRVGRIQNFKNWSPDMVPDQSKTCLGLEYFCFEGDGLWTSDDAALVKLAGEELAHLGICTPDLIFDGVVVRQQKAYPVYDDAYQSRVDVIREYLRSHLPNLHLVGRNGMHKYNNQDHSMMTALLVARNIATGSTFDPWRVNADAVYHEDIRAGDHDLTGRQVPKRIAAVKT